MSICVTPETQYGMLHRSEGIRGAIMKIGDNLSQRLNTDLGIYLASSETVS